MSKRCGNQSEAEEESLDLAYIRTKLHDNQVDTPIAGWHKNALCMTLLKRAVGVVGRTKSGGKSVTMPLPRRTRASFYKKIKIVYINTVTAGGLTEKQSVTQTDSMFFY